MPGYELIKTEGVPIKAWTKGVPVEPKAEGQLRNVARVHIGYVAPILGRFLLPENH